MGDSSALLFADLDCGGPGDCRCREILARRERADDIVGQIYSLLSARSCRYVVK